MFSYSSMACWTMRCENCYNPDCMCKCHIEQTIETKEIEKDQVVDSDKKTD